MRTLPITNPPARLDVRTFKLRVKRSFARAPKRGTRTRACYIELPSNLWDRIVLFMFTCCLFTFLHAFFGFGSANEDLRALNDTFVHPHTTPSISLLWNRGSVASNEDQRIRARRMTRVMVDWRGNYELLPSTTSALVSPASVPQDAFPDPTPAPVRTERGQALDQGSLSTITKVKTPVDVPSPFYGIPYDPFQLEFEDAVDRDVFLRKLACKHHYAWSYFADKRNGWIFVDFVTYNTLVLYLQLASCILSLNGFVKVDLIAQYIYNYLTMSTHSRDYGRNNSLKRKYDDDDYQRRKRDNGDQHARPDRRHGTNERKENPRRDGERRRDRRDYPEDRRSYGREYDDRRRGGDRELDNDRESRRDRDRNREYQTRSDHRHRESSIRERTTVTRSRRSASPRRRSRSPTRSKSPVDKAKPNFNPSGLLAAATNTIKAADGTSTVLKYNEPPEARKPTLGWRLYVFKGSEQTALFHIHRQSAYLIGRDRTVADIFIEHPSCSKQHAVIQHRQVQEKDEFGGAKAVIKPFIVDLESTNATHVNDEAIPTTRFYELKAGDVIKFGLSNREYVLLHDESA
ncbi:hypothetical protein J3R83DRAFT_12967 [Lanmaoa asiatica]|nr:hypothetical protein J3R83DRAFT_12967 [Lanmaoa asiatica]